MLEIAQRADTLYVRSLPSLYTFFRYVPVRRGRGYVVIYWRSVRVSGLGFRGFASTVGQRSGKQVLFSSLVKARRLCDLLNSQLEGGLL